MIELDDPMHEGFCQAMAADIRGNGTQAAIDAGYTNNRASAAVQASRLLKDVKVRARIRELRRELLREAGYSGERSRMLVLEQLHNIAGSDITDVVQISPGPGDPNRQRVLDDLAAMHGGQRALDFGETIAVPTTALPRHVTGAIRTIECVTDRGGAVTGFKVVMHDKNGALKTLAEINRQLSKDLSLGGTLRLEASQQEEILRAAKEMAVLSEPGGEFG